MLGGFIRYGHQEVETSIAGAFKQGSSCFLVLDQKEERMELNKDVIIKSKLVNR
jgi:hypothetical protein